MGGEVYSIRVRMSRWACILHTHVGGSKGRSTAYARGWVGGQMYRRKHLSTGFQDPSKQRAVIEKVADVPEHMVFGV